MTDYLNDTETDVGSVYTAFTQGSTEHLLGGPPFQDRGSRLTLRRSHDQAPEDYQTGSMADTVDSDAPFNSRPRSAEEGTLQFGVRPSFGKSRSTDRIDLAYRERDGFPDRYVGPGLSSLPDSGFDQKWEKLLLGTGVAATVFLRCKRDKRISSELMVKVQHEMFSKDENTFAITIWPADPDVFFSWPPHEYAIQVDASHLQSKEHKKKADSVADVLRRRTGTSSHTPSIMFLRDKDALVHSLFYQVATRDKVEEIARDVRTMDGLESVLTQDTCDPVTEEERRVVLDFMKSVWAKCEIVSLSGS